MKKPFILLAGSIFSLFALTSCSNGEYQNAMEKGIKSLGEKNYHEASIHFEIALNEKENDRDALSYFDQALQMEKGIQAYEQKKLGSALDSFNMVINHKNGLKAVQMEAQKLKAQILSEKELISSFEEKVALVKNLVTNKNYNSAQEQLQLLHKQIETNDILSDFQSELTKLTKQVNLALNDHKESQKQIETKKIKESNDKEIFTYELYKNDRFGFSFQYPTGLAMDPPPTNGDGARFYNKEFNITAYGGHTNVVNDGETIATYYQEDINSISEEIAYQRLTEDWYVISYQENREIIYKKFFFGDEVFNTFIIVYPANKQEKYGPITTHIAKTFVSSAN